ncbi:MAG: VWA domain-containing protein [Betaproteobacteria bacterium]
MINRVADMFAIYAVRDPSFQWPSLLWLLLLVPLLVVLYVALLARQRKRSRRFASLTTSGPSAAQSGPFRRHGPAILLLLGLTLLILAVARPQAVIMLPSRVDSIILAMDVSGSMRATDIAPNRLAAAQAAAKAFVAAQPSSVRVGVVSIASTAALVQSPTDKREDIVEAIDRFQLQKGSALGSGIVIALTTLLPDSGIDVEKVVFGRSMPSWVRDTQKKAAEFQPVPPGSNGSVAIVLLSDGQSNFGPDLEAAGKLAADRGVRVYAVGIGTKEGATLSVEGWSMRVKLDEDALKKLAATTRGEYFQASNAGELKKIYRQLGARLALDKGKRTEVTALLVGLGTLLVIGGVLLSLFRFNRVL